MPSPGEVFWAKETANVKASRRKNYLSEALKAVELRHCRSSYRRFELFDVKCAERVKSREQRADQL